MSTPIASSQSPYRPLLEAPEVTVADYLCNGAAADTDERIVFPEIVFVRSGSFRASSSLGDVLADSAQVVFLPPGESARFSHPGDCRDRSFFLSLAPRVLHDLLEEVRPRANERPEAPFSRPSTPCRPRWFEAQRRLRERLLARSGRRDVLDDVEAALDLAATTLAETPSRGERAPSTRDRRQRRARVEAVQIEISRRLDESLTLSELGRLAGVSGFRLAREFRAETGWSIHQYRLGLRLHAAAERLADGEPDLTRLALELGFADHAHFSTTFRKRFGAQPSAYRGSFSRPARREPAIGRHGATRRKVLPK